MVATIRPLPGQTKRVRAELEAVIPAVHAEPGCEFYALHESPEGILVFIEAWDSRDQWIDHINGPTVADINRRVDGLLAAEPEVIELGSVPAGNLPQGLLPEVP